MNRLRRYDKVAYVRFASVYLDFKDVQEFMTELKDLLKSKEPEVRGSPRQKVKHAVKPVGFAALKNLPSLSFRGAKATRNLQFAWMVEECRSLASRGMTKNRGSRRSETLRSNVATVWFALADGCS